MTRPTLLAIAALTLLGSVPGTISPAQGQALRTLTRTSRIEAAIGPGPAHRYLLPLGPGESAELVVLQQGVDLAVDVVGPDGRVIETVDSPNGRNGPEPVLVGSARGGDYIVQVRTLAASEPVGAYRLTMTTWRDAVATRRWTEQRQRARQLAADWLRDQSIPMPAPLLIRRDTPMPSFDALAGRVRVMGLGEATHGSREFADLRLAVTRRLVERHGYRIIALEMSESRMRDLARYVSGEASAGPEVSRLLASGWFGRRSRAELVEWARSWNIANPDDRVRLIGVDAQDFASSRAVIGRFVSRVYGDRVMAAWRTAEAELIAADEQSQVFGNSDISAATRSFAVELLGALEQDRPHHVARFGARPVDEAIEAARNLAQFADYNGNNSGAINRNRDWYMAVNVLRALDSAPADARAVYWAHNAHVATTAASYQPTGTVLRAALGCDYAAVGATFGQGSFIAQIPNDPEDRLALSTLPAASEDSIERVAAGTGNEGAFMTWPCGPNRQTVPAWLAEPRPMRWVGALFSPGDAPSTATRPFVLTVDFDALFYLPVVTAEDMPTDRPIVPPRPRPGASGGGAT